MLLKISGLSFSLHKPGRFFPLLLISIGIGCFIVVVYPIAGFYLHRLIYPELQLISPVDSSVYPAPIIVGSPGDYSDSFSRPADWFTRTAPLPSPVFSRTEFFYLSVPRLGLMAVSVKVNGTDLKKHAVHYPGTSLPGEYGNAVVFGHSALPQFYRPGSALTIFNPLLDIRAGDLILIKLDDLEYAYRVTGISEVDPDQIEVLAQDYSRREITLITCVPLGTYWHRLVVRGELVR